MAANRKPNVELSAMEQSVQFGLHTSVDNWATNNTSIEAIQTLLEVLR